MLTEVNKLTFYCCECNKELKEDELIEFAGGVACEPCVRTFYEKRNSIDPDIQWDIELEIRTRRNNAANWLRRNRRSLEKQAAKGG
jgi:hypothetical protein